MTSCNTEGKLTPTPFAVPCHDFSHRAGGLLGPQEESRIKSAALTFRDVFGAVPGADVRGLEGCLADNYGCQVRRRNSSCSSSSVGLH